MGVVANTCDLYRCGEEATCTCVDTITGDCATEIVGLYCHDTDVSGWNAQGGGAFDDRSTTKTKRGEDDDGGYTAI